MDHQLDIVSDLQHSLMNSHGLLKKMKAISRQLNASHTLLLMKQSTSNEQLSEYVQDIRMKLEIFHEEMIHELASAFQEKTSYLNSCLVQLQREEATVKQLCLETEGLLKKVVKTVNPSQFQRGKTLLEAFKIISKENSADLELEEDVICLDFVPQRPADDYSNFGSIRINHAGNVVKADNNQKDLNQNRVTLSKSSQTEVLFKDYCPFCGRTYSKGKKDVDSQTMISCVECETPSPVQVDENVIASKSVNSTEQVLQNKCPGQDIAINNVLKNLDNRKLLETVNPNISPCVRLVRNFLEDVGLSKGSTSEESISSYPEDCKSSPSKPLRKEKLSGKVQIRKTAGKKLKDKKFEEDFVWNSSDDEMAEERSSINVKNHGDGKEDGKKHPRHDTDNHTQNLYVPPPPGITEIPNMPALPQSEKETLKQKKPMLAARSLSMLTGLMTTAKAENVIHEPHVSHKDLPEDAENSDWWRKTSDTENFQSHVSPIIKPKSIEKCLPFGGGLGSGDSKTEYWLNDQSNIMTSNSITSTPKGQKKIAESVYTDQSLIDEEAEEFRLRRPSTNIKISPRPVTVKTEKDANNNFNAIPINYRMASLEGSGGHLDNKKQSIIPSPVKFEPIPLPVKFEPVPLPIKFEPVPLPVKSMVKTENFQTKDDRTDGDSSGIADSGWEEDSGVSDGKDSGKFGNNSLETSQEKATFIRGGEIWTETVPKFVTTGKSNPAYRSNVGRGHNAMNDWCETGINSKTGQHYVHSLNKLQEAYSSGDEWCETGSGAKSKQVTSLLTGKKGHNPKDDWGSSVTGPSTGISTSKINSGEPNEAKLNKPEPDTPSVNPRASTLSPVSKYIEKMSKGVSKILPPIPAKLIGKIGGKDQGFHFPIGVTTSSNGDVIVADTGNHLVKIFTADGKLKLTIGTTLKPAMQRPSAVVVNERDELFVKDDKCIRMFDLERGAIIRQMGIGQLSQPYGKIWLNLDIDRCQWVTLPAFWYGLSMTPDKNLLTLDVDKRNPKIVIFSQKGELVNSFPYEPLQGRIPQTRCRFLDVGQSKLVVSDLGRHEIYVTDLQGKIKSYFGRGGYGNGEFFEPSGVVVDSTGNMIVADSKNDRVQIFRPDGGFVCIVGFSEPIKRPSDMHLTEDGRLIVVNFLNHQLKIYKLGDT